MPVEVILPRVDMDMTAGRITKWHVKDGDSVKKGVVIFEIETDKAAMEVEAPGDGVIHKLASTESESIPVGSTVAFIYDEGEVVVDVPAAMTTSLPPSAISVDIRPEIEVSVLSPSTSGGVRATPLARKLARVNGVALDKIAGSGPRGRVVAEDIRRFVSRPEPTQSAHTSEDPVLSLYELGSNDLVPHNGMFRTIARRLVEAKQSVPHFYLTVACDLDNLLTVRDELNAHAIRRVSGDPSRIISVNDLLIKALALALQGVPAANATWSEDGILRHRSSDVAVAVEGSPFAPVIRNAESKALFEISEEMKDLAQRARAGNLSPSKYQGGTTAISNLHMYGVEQFASIIYPPHASILAVGSGVRRPAVVGGEIVARTQMSCTLSCDHRVIDGALGAELLDAFRLLVEIPVQMLA